MAEDAAVVEKIAETLREENRVERVILFGSRAKGTAGPDSDYDLMVVERELGDRIGEGRRLRGLLRQLGVALDLVVVSKEKFDYWKDTPGNVYYEAAQEGRVLYEAA